MIKQLQELEENNMEQTTIRSVITPNDKFVRSVFEINKAYLIDIYQREYRWKRENVETLLNDIEVRFNQHTRRKVDPKEIQEDVQANFEPYYLNTFLTHTTAANVSIVDGQQRLTTLLLIIIKFFKMLEILEQDPTNHRKTFTKQSIEKLILERDDFGEAEKFKIFNTNREDVFRSILNGLEFKPGRDETQQRILMNYKVIDQYYEKFFAPPEDSSFPFEITKLTYYITYLLDRISIVEIKIEKQKNVAMIFEVVNDRGLGLKPYEILKGKLLGELPNEQKEKANEIWVELQNKYYAAEIKNSTESKIDLDMFFQTYFRAKFANSEKDYEKYESDYHYEIYRDPQIRKYFKNFEDQNHLYRIITEDIKYFADLYFRLRTEYENEYLIYNKLLDQNQQYLLIMSTVTYEDADLENKISRVAQKFDQFHSIIRLMDIYESQKFQRLIYPLIKDVREGDISDIDQAFDTKLLEALVEEGAVQKDEANSLDDLFTYDRFKNVRNRWVNFSKYVLLRIDRTLAQDLDKPSYAGGALKDLEDHFNKTTRKIYGMHLEHIYAYNDSNKAMFLDEHGIFDEQEFIATRNKLGMVLLLKDRQNESSNNESYSNKIDTYSKSNFIWNEMMVGHLHGVDAKKLPEWSVEKIHATETGAFPLEKVESRQQSLFKAIKQIWLEEL